MTITKDLKTLNNDLKALGEKIETLLKTVEQSAKADTNKQSTAMTVKAKASKSVPVKKVPALKKAKDLTATDQVLAIILRSKKGVDTTTLMKKTGFDQRKIWSIINRASKVGKIQRVDRGIYIGAK